MMLNVDFSNRRSEEAEAARSRVLALVAAFNTDAYKQELERTANAIVQPLLPLSEPITKLALLLDGAVIVAKALQRQAIAVDAELDGSEPRDELEFLRRFEAVLEQLIADEAPEA